MLPNVSRVAVNSAARPPWSQDQRCQPLKEGIRPVGGKTHLRPSQYFEGIFSIGGSMSSHNFLNSPHHRYISRHH
jgi:hypothetical protein